MNNDGDPDGCADLHTQKFRVIETRIESDLTIDEIKGRGLNLSLTIDLNQLTSEDLQAVLELTQRAGVSTVGIVRIHGVVLDFPDSFVNDQRYPGRLNRFGAEQDQFLATLRG